MTPGGKPLESDVLKVTSLPVSVLFERFQRSITLADEIYRGDGVGVRVVPTIVVGSRPRNPSPEKFSPWGSPHRGVL